MNLRFLPALLVLLFSAPSFAHAEPSSLDAIVASQSTHPLGDLKTGVLDLSAESSCLPDYLKRRDQLALKLKLSPLTIIGYEGGGFLAGAGLGRILILSGAAVGEMADLAALAAGLAFGVIAGTGASIASLTANLIKLAHINRMMKIIHDSRSGGGPHLQRFYNDHRAQFKEGTTEESIAQAILQLDSSRKLCDGTFGRSGNLIDERKLKNKLIRSPKRLAEVLAAGN